MEKWGYKTYSSFAVRTVRYCVIIVLAFGAPLFLFPFFFEHVGAFFAGLFLAFYVFALGVALMVFFEMYKYYWNFPYPWQQVIKRLLFRLDDVLAQSALARKEKGVVYIPKTVRDRVTFPLLFVFWEKAEEGLAFSLLNYDGSRAYELFAEQVSAQLPEEFVCRYLGSSDSKAHYVIALHNPKIPSIEADL